MNLFPNPPLLQGLYVFAVYFLMHNQLCWPSKASYTVEMNGHSGPDATYQGGASTVGGEISKSTQNLISAMEEVPHAHTHTLVRSHPRALVYASYRHTHIRVVPPSSLLRCLYPSPPAPLY